MAARTGRSRRSSAPSGSGWRALSQPYESTATGSASRIVVRRSVSSDSFASGGTSCHGGTTPLRSGITSPSASLSSHAASMTSVKARSGSSSAPPNLCHKLFSGSGCAAAATSRASSAASSSAAPAFAAASPAG